MNTNAHALIVGLVAGVIAYFVIRIAFTESVNLPTSTEDLGTLAVIIVASVITGFITGNGNTIKYTSAADSDVSRGQGEETGTVKWFNAKKGYGFITDDKTKKDIFLFSL